MNWKKYLLTTAGWIAGAITGSIFISLGCWWAGLNSEQTFGAVLVAAGVSVWARSDQMDGGDND